MYILTNGSGEYVMEHPVKEGLFLKTTYPVQARKFNYKQAKSLIQHRSKKFKGFYLVDCETGKIDDKVAWYKGNAGVYLDENDVELDETLISEIFDETNAILNLAGWNTTQLHNHKDKLNTAIDKYEAAQVDILHSYQKYREDHDGRRPSAYKMAKISYLLDDIRDKRKSTKQALEYLNVMQNAITSKYSIEQTKAELEKAKFAPYRARTEYYQKALDILEDGDKHDV